MSDFLRKFRVPLIAVAMAASAAIFHLGHDQTIDPDATVATRTPNSIPTSGISSPPVGVDLAHPEPEAYQDRLDEETAAVWAGFQTMHPGVDPTDVEAFHATLLDVRQAHPAKLDPENREQFGDWLTLHESMRQSMINARAAFLGIPTHGTDAQGREFILTGFDRARPIYEHGVNQNAAVSSAASYVRRNAAFDAVFGPSVDGQGFFANVNDTGTVAQHPEFRDDTDSLWRLTVVRGSSTGNHGTHVAGTIAARGLVASARGMAPAAHIYSMVNTQNSDVVNYGMDWPGRPGRAIVGNSSLGIFDSSINGVYTSTSAAYDQLLVDTPYYLHFYAAGNSGPNYFTMSTSRKDGKNLFAVGSVTDVSRNSAGVRTGGGTIASSSARGPTRDGRIKPDIVANGVGLNSTQSDGGYASTSGTSMASPNAAGSAILLQDYFSKRFPRRLMRASTLMALIINTAEDLGTAGPDYAYGWGMMNTLEAGKIIRGYASDPSSRTMVEDLLVQGETVEIPYQSDGTQPVSVTLVWTDPPGAAQTSNTVTTRALRNDLNLRIIGPGETSHLPYVMPYVTGSGSLPPFDPGLLGAAAAKGVNTTDNKIQVYLPSAAAGNYRVEISHAGALTGGSQPYSLAVTGMTGTTPASPPVITSHPESDPVEGDFSAFEVIGEGFMLGSDLEFRRDGHETVPAYALEVTGQRLFARVDNSLLAPGAWQVVVRNPDGTETVSDSPYQLSEGRTLTWSGGTAGGNQNMVSAGNWKENQSPADAPIADLIIAGRNGATGNIPLIFVGGDYAVRSISFDNAEGRFNPDLGLRISPTTLSTSTIVRTLSFASPQDRILAATHDAMVDFTRFSSTASMSLNLNFSGRAAVLTDATSQITLSTASFTGPGGIRKTGPGTLRLDSTNNHAGGITIEEGLVIVTSPGALGENPVSLAEDSLVINGGAIRFESSSVGPSSTRGIQVGENVGTIDISGTAVTVFGPIADVPGEAGLLAKTGSFILRLNANSHSGGTHLQQGRIRYNSADSFGTGDLTFEAGTGILAASAGLAVPNNLVLTGGSVRFGGDGQAHIHDGDIDLTGETRGIRMSDPVTFNGDIFNGGLEIEADSQALALTLTGNHTHEGGTSLISGTLVVQSGSIGAIDAAAGTTLVVGLEAEVNGPIETAGVLSYGPAIPADGMITLSGGTLTSPGNALILGPGASISGSGVIISNIQLAPGSSLIGTPGGTLLVLGEITGSGEIQNISRGISPSTTVGGVETSPFGVATFNTSLDFPQGFPVTGTPAFRFDLGDPAGSDRVDVVNAFLGFGTGGLDLSKIELVLQPGFTDGIYPLITSTERITGTLGPDTRTTLGGLPAWLRIGSDGKSIELRIGTAADEFPYTSGETYFGRNNYIEYRAGDVPILLASGHDGALEPAEIPLRTYGSTARDISVHDLTLAMAAEFTARTGKRPHVILNHLRRNRLDPNREIVEAAQGSPQAEQAWTEYHHSFIRTARDAMERSFGFAITFDMHGHGHEIDRLELGYLLGATELNTTDATLNLPGYTWQSSLRSMMLNNPSLPFPALVRGPKSLGQRFVEIGVPAWPSATFPTIGSAPFFNGGYTTNEHSCLDCNSSVDAIQIETHFGVRSNSTNRANFARNFVEVLQAYLVDHYQYSPGTGSIFSLTTDRTESSRGGPAATLTVRRGGHLDSTETMSLGFSGSAIKGTDYTVSTESVSFAAGQSTRTINLTPATPGLTQGDRNIIVTLVPQYRQSTEGESSKIILGDGTSQTVRIAAATTHVRKEDGTAIFQISRTQAGPALEVPLTSSGTAIPGGHYDSVASAVIPAGALTAEVEVRLRDDGYFEDDLALVLAIAPSPAFTVGIPSQAGVRLTDSDRPGSLTGWYTGGLSGNVWQDRSGFQRHATTLPGGLGPVADSGAIAFDGVSATAALPALPVDPGGPFTLAFFFRPEIGSLTSERNLASYAIRNQPGGFGIYFATPTQLRTALGTGSPITVSGAYNDGNWRHYALTVTSGGTARIHINGQFAATGTLNGPLLPDRLFWIGWNPGEATTAGFFKGTMRDLRIYQQVVPDQGIAALAAGGTNFQAWLADFGLDGSTGADGYFAHYAFGRKPSEPAPGTPLFHFDGGKFELDFTRQLDSTDIRYEIQRSPSLADGDWQSVATLLPSAEEWTIHRPDITVSDSHGQIRMTDAAADSGEVPRVFYRIEAIRQ